MYPVESLLPSERALMDEFLVSRETARKAIAEIKEYKGYIHLRYYDSFQYEKHKLL